jgi:CRP/FNR family transcriptional activator FtrB
LPPFSSVNTEDLLILNEASDLARIGPGEEVLRQGETPRDLIFLISGYVAVSHSPHLGQRRLADVAVPPRLISGAASLGATPAINSYHTITSVRLVLVPVATFHVLMERSAELAQALNRYLLGELQQREREVVELKLSTSAQRLARYLLELAGPPGEPPARFLLPFEKRFLAGKIGCTQESLSRTFALLRTLGVETGQSGSVVIQDLPLLQAFADNRRQLHPPPGGRR